MGDIEYPIPKEAYIKILEEAAQKVQENNAWDIFNNNALDEIGSVVTQIGKAKGMSRDDRDDLAIALGNLKIAQSGNLEKIKGILPEGENVRHVDKHSLEIREFFRENLPKIINKAKGLGPKSPSEGRGR